MYQIPRAVQGFMFRLEEADSISRIKVLKPETVAALKEHNISIIEDLMDREPTELEEIDGISAEEQEKLQAVYLFLFRYVRKERHGQ